MNGSRPTPADLDAELSMEVAFAAVEALARRIGGEEAMAQAWLAVAVAAAGLDAVAAQSLGSSSAAMRPYRRAERAYISLGVRLNAERQAEAEGRLVRFPRPRRS